MRFRSIQIPSYGPFTDFTLDLPKGANDFHLFYGPNEAGKSSLLRAIRALLFGIPGQTGDNFLHDYKKLRILAKLEDSNGNPHIFQRRKGTKNTLLDADSNPMLDADLQHMLGVVDERYFDSMFGLGSEELRQGADDLLRGEGRLGEALFSASLGGTPVDRVIQALEAEAGELFSGRAQRRIRKMARLYGEQLHAKKEALIKPEAWEEVERALQEANHQMESLKSERTKHQSRKDWLGRCRSALPMVGQLAECRTKIEALPPLPELPGSFADEIRGTRSTWSEATREVERLGEQISRLEEQVKRCQLNPDALALEAAIDGIHTRLGIYRENQNALVSKQGEAQAKEAAVRRSCRDLGVSTGLDELESLRTTQPQFADAADKADRLNQAKAAHEDAIRKEQDLNKELNRLRSEPSATDPETLTALKNLLAGISGTKTIASELTTRQTALTRSERSIRDLHGSLSGVPMELEAARALKLPSRSMIESFRERFDEAERTIRDLADEKLTAWNKIRELNAEIERRARQGELPSLLDLEVSRNNRERGWALVLDEWKGGGAKEYFVDGKPLEEAYPEAVIAADGIADRLRLEAEAVAQLEELRSKHKLEEECAQVIDGRTQAAKEELAGIREDWTKAWQECHSSPATPTEMLEWRETWQEFVRELDQWSDDRKQLETDRQRVSNATAGLAKALKSDGTDFEELLEEAQERFEALDAARVAAAGTEHHIKITENELSAVRKNLPGLQEAVLTTEKDWKQCRQALFLPEGLSPASQIETLRSRREMFQDFDGWKGLLNECKSLEERIKDYEGEIEEAVTTMGLAMEGTEAQEKALWTELDEAKRAQTSHDELQERLAELSDDREAAQSEVVRARTAFDDHLTKAGLGDESGLDSWLSHFENHHQLRGKLDQLRNGLAGLSLGSPVDEFVKKVEDEDLENLESTLTELEEILNEVEKKIEEVRSARQEWEGRRKGMEEAQDQAARHEQQTAFVESTLEADAERFVRLRVAIHLLRGQIEAFRRQNQGPFMVKASRWFAEVTGGAFSGIGTSFGDGDEPVIAGQRAGNMGEVLVPGMSEGTRDQLYLALRFAGLELHLEDHEPMPMILDDLLVHFDDARATHALGAMAKLAERSQVLLFTHHAHVVELAKTHLATDRMFFHEIN